MFGLSEVEIDEGYGLIPEGNYNAIIDSAEWKTAKSGSEYLNIKFKLTGPTHTGRFIWSMFNLLHHNSQVQNIAKQGLKRILVAIDKPDLEPKTKEEVIHAIVNKVVSGKVVIVEGQNGYQDKNDIRYFKKPTESNPLPEFGKDEIPF